MTNVLEEGNPLGWIFLTKLKKFLCLIFLPEDLHFGVFLPAIMSLGSEEQQTEWVPKAWNANIIGTYAQTELGHGTYVRGLETIATYDSMTKEFVMHSPSITAYKVTADSLLYMLHRLINKIVFL